jgi:hypothetical protein
MDDAKKDLGGALGLGGTRLLRNPSVNPMSASERMAHSRSFRKKGGSMKPLGVINGVPNRNGFMWVLSGSGWQW